MREDGNGGRRPAGSDGSGTGVDRPVAHGGADPEFLSLERELTVFNPGSIGPRRFQLPIVFGVIEVAGARLGMHHVDCETGEIWQP